MSGRSSTSMTSFRRAKTTLPRDKILFRLNDATALPPLSSVKEVSARISNEISASAMQRNSSVDNFRDNR